MSANKKVFIKSKLVGLFTFGFLSSILSATGIVGIGSLVNDSKNLSLVNKTISAKNVETSVPITNVSEIFKRIDIDKLNKTTINYTDATDVLNFKYDEDASAKILERLVNNQNVDHTIIPNVQIPSSSDLTLGYSLPLVETSAQTGGMLVDRTLPSTSYKDPKNYPTKVQNNDGKELQNIGYFQTTELQPFNGIELSDHFFQVYSPTAKDFVWRDTSLFNLGQKLFEKRDQLANGANSYYLWFRQTGTKIIYEPKEITLPEIGTDLSDPSYDAWNDWLNAYDRHYVVPDTPQIEFLDITTRHEYCTRVQPVYTTDKKGKDVIEYTYEYSKEPNNYAGENNPDLYNFQSGIAFYVEIPATLMLTTSTGDSIQIQQLVKDFKSVPFSNWNEIKQVYETQNQVSSEENLYFFKNKDPIKQNLYRIYSNNTPVKYLNKNYALKSQILEFAQAPNVLDIQNFIVPTTKYDSNTSSYVLSFDFNENFKELILNLYNLSVKAKELRSNTNSWSLLRNINYATIDYKQAYNNETNGNSLYSANWYTNAENDFGLDLKTQQITAISSNGETIYDKNGYSVDTIYPQKWMYLLEWFKSYFSHDIYVDYVIGNSQQQKIKIWDATTFSFVNSISDLSNNNNQKITIKNLYFDNDSTNLVTKLKLDATKIETGTCNFNGNNLVFNFGNENSVDPEIKPEESPSDPIVPPSNDNPSTDNETNKPIVPDSGNNVGGSTTKPDNGFGDSSANNQPTTPNLGDNNSNSNNDSNVTNNNSDTTKNDSSKNVNIVVESFIGIGIAIAVLVTLISIFFLLKFRKKSKKQK